MRRGTRLAGVVVPLVALVGAIAVAFGSELRPVGRASLHDTPTEVLVDCAPLADRDVWGEAANRLCEPVTGANLVQGGLVAAAGGAVGLVLAAVARRRKQPHRAARLTAGAVLGVAIPVTMLGGLSAASTAEVERLPGDERATLDAVGGIDVLDAFEVLELRNVRTGLRVNEERWYVLRAEVAAVRDALFEAGWDLEDVPEDFSSGWVEARSTEAPGTVEVGTYGALLGDRADTGHNARRLLADVDGAAPALAVVHVRPPDLPG